MRTVQTGEYSVDDDAGEVKLRGIEAGFFRDDAGRAGFVEFGREEGAFVTGGEVKK